MVAGTALTMWIAVGAALTHSDADKDINNADNINITDYTDKR